MKPYGSGAPLVIDASAWARQREPGVGDGWEATRVNGLLASCPVGALEILAAARDEATFRALDRAFAMLPQAPVTATVCAAALGASRALAGSRRLPVPDYLVAAAAAERGFGVLHADRHFDLLATVLGFESVSVA